MCRFSRLLLLFLCKDGSDRLMATDETSLLLLYFSLRCVLTVAYLRYCCVLTVAYLRYCCVLTVAYLRYCCVLTVAYLRYCCVLTVAYLRYCCVLTVAYLRYCWCHSSCFPVIWHFLFIVTHKHIVTHGSWNDRKKEEKKQAYHSVWKVSSNKKTRHIIRYHEANMHMWPQSLQYTQTGQKYELNGSQPHSTNLGAFSDATNVWNSTK